MPEALHQLILLACLCNLGRNVDVGFLETPVHRLFLDANQVDDQVGAVDQVSDAVIVSSIEAFDLDHLQHVPPVNTWGHKSLPGPSHAAHPAMAVLLQNDSA